MKSWKFFAITAFFGAFLAAIPTEAKYYSCRSQIPEGAGVLTPGKSADLRGLQARPLSIFHGKK
jgi:hypothetical protein